MTITVHLRGFKPICGKTKKKKETIIYGLKEGGPTVLDMKVEKKRRKKKRNDVLGTTH